MPAMSLLNRVQLTTWQKGVIISIGTGVALMAVVAQYLKRRRKTRTTTKAGRNAKTQSVASGPMSNTPLNSNDRGGSIAGSLKSASPSMKILNRQNSTLSALSDRLSNAGLGPQDTSTLTPQQLGTMGMEALENGINYWEDALAAYAGGGTGQLTLTDQEEAEFAKDIQMLLELAYKLQKKCELLFLDQIADLREFEEFADLTTDVEKLALYQSAMKQFDEYGIPYRCLRTEMVRCSSDLEYLGKLHCIRLAFQWMFQDPATWHWFADSGRQVLTNLLLYADKDPKDFLVAYEEMLVFVEMSAIWKDVETELSVKDVKALTFYDVVLDYILMDAFEDLESPPSSLTAVVQNRWLSNGFKESALSTAVWSVLKAKRRMLSYPNGFMAHFYDISEQMSPLMAWGFLGPDDHLREICQYFKDQVMGYLVDMFSFQKSRYTTVEDLAEDILKHTKERVDNLSLRLCKTIDEEEE